MPELRTKVGEETLKRIASFRDKMGLKKGQVGPAIDLAFWVLENQNIEDVDLLLIQFENCILGDE